MVIGLILACYFIGSIPVAWIVTRLVTGKDLRTLGSGNVGVMNVALSVARWAGLLVFLAEAAKGVAAVWLARRLGGGEIYLGLATIATVIGTRWSIWLRGAGGRGNTAGAAAILIIAWQAVVFGILIWFLARIITHSSFLATRITLLIMPALLGLATRSWWFVLFGIILGILYVSTQKTETDDHLIIKERWPSLWAFLTGPPRR
jgi:glycerol-3-phosphate acyltransferase PlsY